MPKLLSLCQQQTYPDNSIGPDFGGLPIAGFVQCDPGSGDGRWGCYLFAGTAAQLQAINALASVVGIVAVTESGDVRWPELDGTISSAVRTRLNTFASARGWPTIPSGASYRQVVLAVFRRLNAQYDFDGFDVGE